MTYFGVMCIIIIITPKSINFVQGSWKGKLRDRFKFLRRAPTNAVEGAEPPAKRPRNDEGYAKNLELLQEEMGKRKKDRSIALIQTLMEDTFTERRRWIQESQPVVSDIIEKFHPLKIRKVVSFLITIE